MKKTKKKIKLKSVFLFLGILLVIGLGVYIYTTLNITNIYVLGNNHLTEQEIINLSNLTNYPKICEVSTKEVQKKLLSHDLIKSVKVSKSILGSITITIMESEILYELKNGHYMTDEKKEIALEESVLGVPLLINECDIQDKLLEKLSLVNQNIRSHISEIEYKPNDLDKERFMLYMNDGNYVYITLSKIELLNSYQEIYPTLEGKKGILYLDSGNHFEIKK